MEERFTLRISADLLKAARAKARATRLSLSQAVRWFLERWLRGEIDAIPPGEDTADD